MEQAKMCESTVSRRPGRVYDEEQPFVDLGAGSKFAYDSHKSSVDEERVGRATRSSSVDFPMFPLVDTGRDFSQILPMSLEDRGKQVVRSLQTAKATPKERIDARPINFGTVIPGIFRSSFPADEDFHFLKNLGLKTILSLVQKDFSPALQGFIKDNGITHRVVDMAGTKKVPIPEDTMKSIMKIALDKENHPILVHCNHGKHRTGCAVAVLRHISGWQAKDIVQEYGYYASPKVRDCDVAYITNFKVSSLCDLFEASPTHDHKSGVFGHARKMDRMVVLAILMMSICLTLLCFWKKAR